MIPKNAFGYELARGGKPGSESCKVASTSKAELHNLGEELMSEYCDFYKSRGYKRKGERHCSKGSLCEVSFI